MPYLPETPTVLRAVPFVDPSSCLAPADRQVGAAKGPEDEGSGLHPRADRCDAIVVGVRLTERVERLASRPGGDGEERPSP
jgi:hypothetical protein